MKNPITTVTVLIAILLTGCATQPPADILTITPMHTQSQTYIVKAGDSIYSIAREQRLDPHNIARNNNLVSPYTIYAGQHLKLRGAVAANNSYSSQQQSKQNSQLITANSSAGYNTITSNQTIQSSKTQDFCYPKKPQQHAKYNTNSTQTKQTTQTNIKTTNSNNGQQTLAIKQIPAAKNITWIWPTNGPILSRFAKGITKKNGINISGAEGTAIKAVAPGTVVYSGNSLRGYGNLIIIKHNDSFLSAYAHNKTNLVKEGATIMRGQQIAAMGKTGANKVMLHFEIRYNGVAIDPERVLPKKH